MRISVPIPKAIRPFRSNTNNIASGLSDPTACAVIPLLEERKKFKTRYK